MINLQMPKVLANIRLAIKERRLQAIIMDDRCKSGKLDWEDREDMDCGYRMSDITHPSGKPCGCAIGVSIPDEAYSMELENKSVVRFLKDLNEPSTVYTGLILETNDRRESLHLVGLQKLHDRWVLSNSEHKMMENKQAFMDLLKSLETAYAA